CKHVYEYPFDENVLKNHYMKKHLKIWESIKESKRGRKARFEEKKNFLIQQERKKIFSVAQELNNKLNNSMSQLLNNELNNSIQEIELPLESCNDNNIHSEIVSEKNNQKKTSFCIEFEGDEKVELQISNFPPIKAKFFL
ncbi:6043_t:CDS:2, partial [Scutellospora calospora]